MKNTSIRCVFQKEQSTFSLEGIRPEAKAGMHSKVVSKERDLSERFFDSAL